MRYSFEDIASLIRQRLRGRSIQLIAVDGLGGAGKSTFAGSIAPWLSASIIQVDDFYLPRSRRPKETEGYGESVDWRRLRDTVLIPLTKGQATEYQRYDWTTDRLTQTVPLAPGGCIIIEGVYSMHRELVRFYDLRIWIECPYDLRLARGLDRDGEAARDTWVTDWMRQEGRYIKSEHPQTRADLMINGVLGRHEFAEARFNSEVPEDE